MRHRLKTLIKTTEKYLIVAIICGYEPVRLINLLRIAGLISCRIKKTNSQYLSL